MGTEGGGRVGAARGNDFHSVEAVLGNRGKRVEEKQEEGKTRMVERGGVYRLISSSHVRATPASAAAAAAAATDSLRNVCARAHVYVCTRDPKIHRARDVHYPWSEVGNG